MIITDKQKQLSLLFFLILLMLFIASVFVLKFYPTQEQTLTSSEDTLIITPPSGKTITPSITSTPTPIPLISGAGTYSVSHGKTNGPRISKVTFDPLDAQKNKNLTISVELVSTSSTKSVIGTLTTDNQELSLNFTKQSEINNQPIWTTSFSLPDTVLYQYTLKLTATNSEGSTNVTVAPR